MNAEEETIISQPSFVSKLRKPAVSTEITSEKKKEVNGNHFQFSSVPMPVKQGKAMEVVMVGKGDFSVSDHERSPSPSRPIEAKTKQMAVSKVVIILIDK